MNTRAEAIEAIRDFASQEGIDNDAALATMTVIMVEMSMDPNPRTWESWDSQDLDPEKEPNNYWKSVVNRTCAYLSFDVRGKARTAEDYWDTVMNEREMIPAVRAIAKTHKIDWHVADHVFYVVYYSNVNNFDEMLAEADRLLASMKASGKYNAKIKRGQKNRDWITGEKR